ncbi:MAG: ExbD/TolR family protein, partial [Candidatus Binatia bacterium]
MAPLIDVVFLLLLFFMVTSSFEHPEAIELDLPQSRTAVTDEDRAINVAVDAAGNAHLDGQPIALADLESAVAQRIGEDPDAVVAVRTASGALVQRMVEVLDAVRAGGGKRIAFRTDPSAAAVSAPAAPLAPAPAAPAPASAPAA